MEKEKHIAFLWITSLIFMILFAVRGFTGAEMLRVWGEYSRQVTLFKGSLDQVYRMVIIVYTLTLIIFLVMLTFFILTCCLRDKDRTLHARKVLSQTLFGFAVAALVCGFLYLITEYITFIFIGDLVNLLNIDAAGRLEINAQMYGSLLFDLTFVAFGIVNVVRATYFARQIKQSCGIVKQRIKHIAFLFTTSLIFMVAFFARSIWGITMIGRWNRMLDNVVEYKVVLPEIANQIRTALGLHVFALTVVLVVLTACFIFVCKSKNKNVRISNTIPKLLLYMIIATSIFSICNLIFGQVFMANVKAANPYVMLESYIVYGISIFDIVFFIFAVLCIIKSNLLIKQNKQNYKTMTGENLI